MFAKRRKADPSVYEHLRAHAPVDGSGLSADAETLPDSGDLRDGVPWAVGARDGVLTHHWAGSADPDEVERLHSAIVAAVKSRRAYDALLEVAIEVRTVSLVDEIQRRLRSSELDQEAVYRLGHRLAVTSRHREPVKLGIAILGLFDADHHRDELMTLGRHEEFTLFAAVALANRATDAEPDLWELARQVAGWGRIHLVERLADSTKPEIRDWILRAGFRNDVADGYLATIAAEVGDLAGRLAEAGPDDELLHAAADILRALCSDHGPFDGMADYADGRRAAELFLGHMTTRAQDLRHYLAVHDVHRYAEREWPALVPVAAEILARPQWPELARRGLASTQADEFHRADRVCDTLGISTLRVHMERLRAEPYDPFGWFAATRQADASTIDEVVGLAVETLPLAQIGTGPADGDGVGEMYAPHRCLDHLLPTLGDWPGRGWPLVAAALASPVTRNRNQSIRTLAAWDRSSWPAQAAEALDTALAREPVAEVRDRMRNLANGRPLED
ncbi:hypothetical protein [Actinomadura sp. HBU206391]|uniref:hypothetical protein n=1 Tax=Actinomadura sp. HBU206391 TaxID=2731692 RepID=UPI0016502F5F|nr:hypothetical protein [Actinomadura sp. HBU206391]MBC6459868.1 hypothetical protein [Actinomadura sp. HBU206391]